VSLWTSPRSLPKVDGLLDHAALADLHPVVRREAVRQVLDVWRASLKEGRACDGATLVAAVRQRAEELVAPGLREVLNATGVVLHTNLGRAPWSERARAAVAAVTRAGCNLEVDLETGTRGGRGAGALGWLTRLTGAEAGLVVNNAAAGVLLALTTLAGGRRVLVSRGELVEIGGGFRVPDVIAACGALLTEVGTTNRTHLEDYAKACAPDVAAVLVVHPSNFRQVGFVTSPRLAELVAWAHAQGRPVVYDQGSGVWRGTPEEPGVCDAIEAGCDVVVASGDKAVGGPQAGLIVGRAEVIRALAAHPLHRALRVDKAILAALEATLRDAWLGEPTPAARQADADSVTLAARAQSVAGALCAAGLHAEVVACAGTPGGGTAPDVELPGFAVVVRGCKPASLAAALRGARPAIVGRVVDGSLGFDLRTVHPEDDSRLVDVLVRLAGEGATG
jgi:L-seryl-tRNA(Ser) seleniumtransferase